MSQPKARKRTIHFTLQEPDLLPDPPERSQAEQLALDYLASVIVNGGTFAVVANRVPIGDDEFVTDSLIFHYSSYAPVVERPEPEPEPEPEPVKEPEPEVEEVPEQEPAAA